MHRQSRPLTLQGVDTGSIITSGQIPVDPKTGAVAEDVSAQARQSLENVKAIVEAAGLKVRRHCENDRIH